MIGSLYKLNGLAKEIYDGDDEKKEGMREDLGDKMDIVENDDDSIENIKVTKFKSDKPKLKENINSFNSLDRSLIDVVSNQTKKLKNKGAIIKNSVTYNKFNLLKEIDNEYILSLLEIDKESEYSQSKFINYIQSKILKEDKNFYKKIKFERHFSQFEEVNFPQ